MDHAAVATLFTAAFLGGLIQGLAGFGSTLVALPIAALVLDMRQATPVCCILAVVLNAVLTSRLRIHVQGRGLVLLLAASLPGMAMGAWVLGNVSTGLLKTLLGLAVLTYVWRACHGGRPLGRAGRGYGIAAGFLAGCLGAAIGVNGPPVVAWASRQGWSRDALRGTMTGYFLLAGIGVVTAQAAHSLVTGRVLTLAAMALPALLLGLWAGWSFCDRLDEAAFGRVVLGLLGMTGAGLLFQAVAAGA